MGLWLQASWLPWLPPVPGDGGEDAGEVYVWHPPRGSGRGWKGAPRSNDREVVRPDRAAHGGVYGLSTRSDLRVRGRPRSRFSAFASHLISQAVPVTFCPCEQGYMRSW